MAGSSLEAGGNPLLDLVYDILVDLTIHMN